MLEPRQAWHATLGQLELQLNRATFDTWLKGAELLSYDDGEFTVRVRHAYAKDWLEKHLRHMIAQTLTRIHGRPSQVTFVVFLPNRKRPDLHPAGPLFEKSSGEAESEAQATGAGDSAAVLPPEHPAPASARFNAEPAASVQVETHAPPTAAEPKPKQKRRASSKSKSAKPAAKSTAKPAADAPSEPQPAATVPVTPKPAAHPAVVAPPQREPEPAEPDYSEWDPRFSDIKRHHRDPLDPVALPQLDRRYTFETFVSGPSSHFAFMAAQAVADSGDRKYNPLVFYGGVGLGKTHLLHAIGHACCDGGRQVLYVTAESFTNELVSSIRTKTMEAFRAKYRSAQVLLIDDVHFVAGKSSTEEELYHTLNAIYAAGGQIVVACSDQPRAINGLDVRLRSRLEGGLLADLQPPEYETRLKILLAKSTAQGVTLPDSVAETLARHEMENVRELEGLLTQVTARVTLTRQPLDDALVAQVLNRVTPEPPHRKTRFRDVLEATATYHQLSMDDLLSKRRTKEVVRARQIAMYLAREETDLSFPQIGEALGGRNHSTVLHGYQKIAGAAIDDEQLRQQIGQIRQQLYSLRN